MYKTPYSTSGGHMRTSSVFCLQFAPSCLMCRIQFSWTNLCETVTFDFDVNTSTVYLLQAMSSFSAALASGQLGPLMSQFGLGEDVANAAAQGG